MGSGGGNKGGIIGDVIAKVPPGSGKGGGNAPPPPAPNLPYYNDPYRPNYSYAAGPSYGNYQLPYSSGPFGSNYIPTPGGGAFGQKGGTMSPGFAPPSYGGMMNTLNYGRYPGSGVGYYDPTPDPNYNPSRPPSSRKGGPDIPYVGLPKTPFPTPMPYPEMPGPPAKGLPTPAVQPIQPKGGAF